ncbi:Ig-like domain-containing protein [Flagellimonas lutimaris]|uniref:Ig-like domain-containing protein n=1 Tax=Flagellimonas lutimaris TaxID=475082 RepID=UPI003F5CED0A
MFLLFSILILSCSKDSDLFSDTIEEQIVNKENNTGISSNGFQPVDDEYTINATNTAFLLEVLNNDSIPENVVVDIVGTTVPQDGELTVNEDNVLSYTPTIDDNKGSGDVVTDSFTYTVEITNGDLTQKKQASVTVKTQYSDSDKDMGALKAFPTASGPGSIATGGRGKVLAIVNTLDPYAALTYYSGNGGNDEYYTGGFISALKEENVGYIVFDVSGDLHMGIAQGWYAGFQGVNNKTVFGQSAPEGGITLTERSIRFDGRFGDNQNLIFRYLRSRPIYDQNGVVSTDDDAFTWGFMFYGGQDIIVDHCSVSFAQDKGIGAYIDESHVTNGSGLKNLTFQHNFIQDSNTGGYVEINPNRSGDPEEYVDAVSWHNNIFSSVNRTPNLAFNGRAEKINNIIHNTPSKNTSVYHSLVLNVEGNYYQKQSTTPDKVRVDVDDATSGNPSIYTDSNVFNGTVGGINVNLNGNSGENNSIMWSTLDATITAPSSYFTQTRHSLGFPNPVTVLSPFEAFDKLVSNGDIGAYKYLDDNGYVQTYRDSFDSSQLEIVKNNSDYEPKNASNWVLPVIPHNTRPNSYDTDNDGMADAWEIRTFGDLSQSYRGDFDGDGYTNIEEFMAQVDFN